MHLKHFTVAAEQGFPYQTACRVDESSKHSLMACCSFTDSADWLSPLGKSGGTTRVCAHPFVIHTPCKWFLPSSVRISKFMTEWMTSFTFYSDVSAESQAAKYVWLCYHAVSSNWKQLDADCLWVLLQHINIIFITMDDFNKVSSFHWKVSGFLE